MELQQVVERYAEAIELVDGRVDATQANARTGSVYKPGFQPLFESVAVREIDLAWCELHPGELIYHKTEVPYLDQSAGNRAKVDHVFSSRTSSQSDGVQEWGIEVKRLQFVGDNGKPNDFAVGKVLSPYLKDRGILHDAARLRQYGFTTRIGVIGYSFDYDYETLALARELHKDSESAEVLDNISNVLAPNGPLRTRPLIEFADAILGLRGFLTGPRAEARFDAWRHPAGGRGTVFGWEIRRPHLEPDFDERHPW